MIWFDALDKYGLANVSGRDRLHLVKWEPFNIQGLCGMTVWSPSLRNWTEDPELRTDQLRRLCPKCKRIAKEVAQ